MRGGTGTVGGKFYADELQTAIFLVFDCDGGDERTGKVCGCEGDS